MTEVVAFQNMNCYIARFSTAGLGSWDGGIRYFPTYMCFSCYPKLCPPLLVTRRNQLHQVAWAPPSLMVNWCRWKLKRWKIRSIWTKQYLGIVIQYQHRRFDGDSHCHPHNPAQAPALRPRYPLLVSLVNLLKSCGANFVRTKLRNGSFPSTS